MKYSLLEFICCTSCKGELVCPGGGSGVMEIDSGVLTCGQCGRWFPITAGIPEMLPDHLRDWKRDMDFLSSLAGKLPGDIIAQLIEKGNQFYEACASLKDSGSHFKKAEISIKDKVTEEHFFAPGYTAPFNRENPDFTIDLLKRFSFILPLLELQPGQPVLDTGCGYAWTTEWLMKLGYEAVGVDITRTYIDIGVERMGKDKPHLIIADVENLPLKDASFQAILCYDSFHHLPDRKKAMAHFSRILKEDGNVVLAEPGGEHEHHPDAKEVMKKYGILEKGMEQQDLQKYTAGLDFQHPKQHYLFKMQEQKKHAAVQPYVDANIYTLQKNQHSKINNTPSLPSRVKNLIKRMILKLFVKRQRKAVFNRN